MNGGVDLTAVGTIVGYSCKLMGGGEFEDATEFVGEDEGEVVRDVLEDGGVRGGLP